ncbi:BLUF domain-containing protein [Fertoebacter nigrum]|uniref:BLUF domain-containing protein n=1 Tax=Fertoeibacter niger TaxID=2656921 RepID=A0A8X8GZV7_9RHOB|nr:BLUF domain-containing protein [Fertoeibacter niger]NUB46227.1 BLUF domain-containing protein [Fertoeibacter niger]
MSGSISSVNGATAGLVSLCYRSVAQPGLDVPDVLAIVESAQRQNNARNVTGVLFYDHGRFLQWLEGTNGAVTEVMSMIRTDRRHSDIEVLVIEPLPVRRYAEWHMQLCCGEEDAELMTLAEREHVVVLGEAMMPDAGHPIAATEVQAIGGFLADACRAVHEPLENLVPVWRARPQPIARVALRAAPLRKVSRNTLQDTAAALTALLVQSDPFSHVGEIEGLVRGYGPLPSDFGRLYQAITATMGEALSGDRLSKAQATLASAALQMVLRRIHHLPDPEHARGEVTVSSAPGDAQFLEATISGEILRGAGWSTSVLYPESELALIDRVKRNGASTLVLAAGQMDPGTGDDRMIGLIGALRAEPDLPALKIIVGGRMARMPADEIAVIGADAAFEHILDVAEAVSRIAPGEARRKARPAIPTETPRQGITTGFLLANVMPRVLHRMSERRMTEG